MTMLKQMMSQNSHWQINKDFAKMFGIECALLATYLIDSWVYYKCPEMFYRTAEDIEKDTTLSRFKQNKALNTLRKKGFIITELKGVPARQHFKIVDSKFLNFFKTVSEISSKQDGELFETNNNIVNNNTINKKVKNNVGNTNSPKKKEILNEQADLIINHISNLSGRKFGGNETNRKEIRNRLKEGWTVEQAKKIAEVKSYEWKDDAKMFKFLNPVTLFRKSHIEKYWEQVEFAKYDPQKFKQTHNPNINKNGQSAESHAREFAEKVKRQFDYIDEHFGKPKQSCNL